MIHHAHQARSRSAGAGETLAGKANRNRWAEMANNLAHPPFADRRFWLAQAMVAAILLARLGADLAHDAGFIPVPSFVWILLLLVPVVFAGASFGLVGSLGAATTGVVALILEEFPFQRGTVSVWAIWSILATVIVVAVLIGERFEHVKESMLAEASLKAILGSEQRFRLAFENNTAGMVVSNLEGRALAVNDAFCQMLGYSAEEILGRDSRTITHPDDYRITEESQPRRGADSVTHGRYSKRYLHRDGSIVYGDVSWSVAQEGAGTALYRIVSIRDVTEERKLASQLSFQALHDPLTGLPNRTLFEDHFSQACARSSRHGTLSALFLIDLDDFKGVNDSLGHPAGDQLLVALARRLERVTRSCDTLARFGGDEFLYLAEDLSPLPAAVEEVAERLRNTLSEALQIAGTSVEQRASIGVVICDGSHREWSEAIQEADAALYEAKRLGKDQYAVFNPAMLERASSSFKLLQELRQALSTGGLRMHYQPLVDLASSQVVGFEALMRWPHPSRRQVPPDVFIPLAERSNLIVGLGFYALSESLREASGWKAVSPGQPPPYVSVNISCRQLHDPGLVGTIEDLLAVTRVPPERLVLEITEGGALADIAVTSGVIHRLKQLRVGIALDDFGTGFSSLSYLALFRPTIIKIDRSFVASAQESVYGETLLEAIISLGHRLEMTVLAEGIETAEQLAHLRDLGCDMGQGFLFSPALPPEELSRFHLSAT